MSSNNVLATVDLGSNSFRLLIATIADNGVLHSIDQIKETVRLAAGLNNDKYLTRESQMIALEVLARFNERLSGFKKNQVRVVATSTLRVARNAEEFIVIANKTLGFNIEVISGAEEARLIYIGAMHSLAFSKEKRLVIDVGGGSTEFITGIGFEPQIMESVTMGCVTFSNRYFIGGELNDNNFANAIFACRSKVQSMRHLFASHDWHEVIGTSGTAHALYSLCTENNLADKITLDALYKVKKILIKQKNIAHIAITGLKEDRSPVIAGGIAIMIAVMEELKITSMTIADGALREGVMYDLLGRKSDHDLRFNTVERLRKNLVTDIDQGKRVSLVTLKLYNQIIGKVKGESDQLKLLEWAAELYEVGLSISHNDYHKHGAYILANSDLAGFSRPEQILLAELVRSHRGNLSKILETFRYKHKTKMLLMIISLRLAVILNRNRKVVPDNIIDCTSRSKNGFDLTIDGTWLKQNPLTCYSLKEEVEQWGKSGLKIRLITK